MANSYSILRDLENALRPLIEADKGQIEVAGDLDDALKMLTVDPKSWRIILLWDGHLPQSNAREGFGKAGLTTFLQMGKGMATNLPVHRDSSSGRVAFLVRMEKLSKWCRALRWPADDLITNYESNIDPAGLVLEDSSWVTEAKTLTHGITWSLIHALEFQTEDIIIIPAS